jgi:pimeloyl-ACP methyl ester carboxylesterase
MRFVGVVGRNTFSFSLRSAIFLACMLIVGAAFQPLRPSTTTTSTTAFGNTRIAAIPRNVKLLASLEQEDPPTSISSTIEQPPVNKKTPALVRRKYKTFLWRNQHDLVDDEEEEYYYDINYRVEGPIDGPPILLVHGFGANVNHFRFQFPALVDAGYRVYAVDLLGFGASDKPKDANYSIELFVQLLSDFIQAMSYKNKEKEDENKQWVSSDSTNQWIVAGNSIGGLCSLGVAERLPELVRAVVLFNCAGGMTGFRYEDAPLLLRPVLYFLQHIVLSPSLGLGRRFFEFFKTRENVESILMSQGVYRNQTNVNEELLEILLRPADDEGAEDVFLKTFAGPPGPTPESILPNLVECKVLALWGEADPWTPIDAGMHPGGKFYEYSDNFELIRLPNTGHCPHDECPDLVHSHMIPWMKALINDR